MSVNEVECNNSTNCYSRVFLIGQFYVLDWQEQGCLVESTGIYLDLYWFCSRFGKCLEIPVSVLQKRWRYYQISVWKLKLSKLKWYQNKIIMRMVAPHVYALVLFFEMLWWRCSNNQKAIQYLCIKIELLFCKTKCKLAYLDLKLSMIPRVQLSRMFSFPHPK